LEERRTQAVISRRYLDPETADTLGALDPDAVARVREQAWPDPRSAEEVHEALSWMGYVSDAEAQASGWVEWLEELQHARRARDAARAGARVLGLARLVAARGRVAPSRGAGRRARRRAPARGLRGAGVALGIGRVAGSGARLPPGVARRADADRRSGLGPAVE